METTNTERGGEGGSMAEENRSVQTVYNVTACQEYIETRIKQAVRDGRVDEGERQAECVADTLTRESSRPFALCLRGMNRDVITDDGINYWKAANGQLFMVLISTPGNASAVRSTVVVSNCSTNVHFLLTIRLTEIK